MKLHTFQELVSRITHLSTRDGKPISITWFGTQAYTNTKSVNIPALPAGTILTPHQFSIWLGYCLHEGPGHQTHTDLELYSQTCKQRNNPQFSYILNLLEDIRIENVDIKLYPGDRRHLDAVHQFVDDKIPPNLCQNPDIMGLIYKHLFTQHRNLDTNRIKGTLDPKTSELISEIDFCTSTQDCITLADKVVKFLNEQQKEQEQEQQQNENKTEDQKDQDQNQSSNNKQQEGKDHSNEKDIKEEISNGNHQNDEENSEEESDTSGSNNNKTSQKNGIKSNEDQDENYSFTNEDVKSWQEITEIKNIIQSLKNETDDTELQTQNPNTNNKSIFPPQDLSLDRIYIPSEENLEQYNSTRAECSSQILALKKMFRIYLQAQTQKSQIRGLEEGKLDTQRLYIAATGAKTIFKDQTSKLMPDTAIELMIDMSGSMEISIARTAAIILAEALNSIPQIKLSISGFTTNSKKISNHDTWNLPNNIGRCVGMDILQFKDFNESYTKCKGKLGAISSKNNTPLGDAYGKALEHIIPRPEPRKIIFLITDGKPEFLHGQNHSDYLLMEKIHSNVQRYKIQTLGLGIGASTQFLDKYFDQAINITDNETLPQKLLKALKQFI